MQSLKLSHRVGIMICAIVTAVVVVALFAKLGLFRLPEPGRPASPVPVVKHSVHHAKLATHKMPKSGES